MAEAPNRTTKKAQEVVATSNGELMTFPVGAKVQVLSDTGSISGPIHFCGMVIISAGDAAQMTVTADGSTIFGWKVGSASASGMALPYPVYCANGVTCTKVSGTSASFIVYYIEG